MCETCAACTLAPDGDQKKLWEEIQRLREKLHQKQRELDDYKKRHPETVGVKHGKAYAIRSPAEPREKTGKKPGGQAGHTGHRRNRPPTIDRHVAVPVTCCPDCGGANLSPNVQEVRARIVEDIPPTKPLVTQYDIDRRYCRDCKTLVEAPVPGVLSGATLGLRAMLVVAWLRLYHRVPQEAVPKLLKALHGLTISNGSVQSILDQLEKEYGKLYDEMLADIQSRPAKNGDETTWPTNGLNEYAWAFVSKWETIFVLGVSRKHEVALDVLGTNAAGTITVDGYSAYRTVANKTKILLQRCWTHILGDAAELADMYGLDGQQLKHGLKRIYAKASAFQGHGTAQDVEALEANLGRELNRPFTSHHCARFARNLWANRADLFRFVTDHRIDGTNNRAERAIRPLAVTRKISGGSRTKRAATVRAKLMSIQHTMAQRGLSFLEGPTLHPRPTSTG